MRRINTLISACFSLTFVLAPCLAQGPPQPPSKEAPKPAPTEKDPLKVAGQFEISLADKGFSWQKVQSVEKGETTAAFYLATKEGSTTKVVLIRQTPKIDADQARLTHCKANINAVGQMLFKQGFKTLKMTPAAPPKPLIGDRVVATVTGTNADGKSSTAAVVMVFGKATFTFQIMADTEVEAATLVKATESLKEQ